MPIQLVTYSFGYPVVVVLYSATCRQKADVTEAPRNDPKSMTKHFGQ